jgi:hypothetical protein
VVSSVGKVIWFDGGRLLVGARQQRVAAHDLLHDGGAEVGRDGVSAVRLRCLAAVGGRGGVLNVAQARIDLPVWAFRTALANWPKFRQPQWPVGPSLMLTRPPAGGRVMLTVSDSAPSGLTRRGCGAASSAPARPRGDGS